MRVLTISKTEYMKVYKLLMVLLNETVLSFSTLTKRTLFNILFVTPMYFNKPTVSFIL